MMNLTLLAAQTAIGDTLAGGNPVLTPVSGEAQMNLWDMALKGGWIMAVLAVLSVVCFYICLLYTTVCGVFLYFL